MSHTTIESLLLGMVRRREAYRLLPHHPIYVTVYDVNGGGDRFVRLFRETWGQITLADRRQMLRFWRATQGRLVPLSTPRFEVYGSHDDFLGRVELGGRVIKFDARSLPLMTDDAVRDLIAHELAHVAQWARGSMQGWFDQFRGEHDHEDMTDNIEQEADDIAGSWGFSGEALETWKWEQHERTQAKGVAA